MKSYFLIQESIKRGATPTKEQNEKIAPLSMTFELQIKIKENNIKAVQELINNGANYSINIVSEHAKHNPTYHSAIGYAISQGNIEITKLLLNRFKNDNGYDRFPMRDSYGYNASELSALLCIAANCGDHDMFKLLARYTAPLDTHRINLDEAFQHAILNNDPQMLELLFATGAQFSEELDIQSQNPKIKKIIHDNQPVFHEDKIRQQQPLTPANAELIKAIEANDYTRFMQALKNGGDPTIDREIPLLTIAVDAGNLKIVQELIKRDASMHPVIQKEPDDFLFSYPAYPIYHAISSYYENPTDNCLKIIKNLLDAGSEIPVIERGDAHDPIAYAFWDLEDSKNEADKQKYKKLLTLLALSTKTDQDRIHGHTDFGKQLISKKTELRRAKTERKLDSISLAYKLPTNPMLKNAENINQKIK